MATDPVRSVDLPLASTLDEFIGNANVGGDVQLARTQKAGLKSEIIDSITLGSKQTVESALLSAPPPAPSTGQQWIVGASAFGAWAGKSNFVARWNGSGWTFFDPAVIAIAVVRDTASLWYWGGSAWSSVTYQPPSYVSLAALNASGIKAPVNSIVFVLTDPTPAINGIYKNTGTLASPIWTFVAAFTGPQGAAGPTGAAWSYLPAAGGSVKAANAAALPSFAYAAGVMTASANGAFPSIDGVALSVGDRFFHWDYTGANGTNLAYGIYTLTNAGSAGTEWTATRATDADSAAELGLISAFVVGGTANAGLVLAVTNAPGAITLGTTAICVTVGSGNAALGAEAALRAAADTALQTAITGVPELVMSAGSSLTVQKYVEGSGSVSPTCYQSVSWVSGQPYTIEVIVKAAERSAINIFCNAGAILNHTFLLDLFLASGAGSTIVALGNGFFLCRVTVTASATAVGNLQIRLGRGVAYTGDGASGLYLVSAKTLLSGINILASPLDFSNASWTKSAATITAAVSISQATAGAAVAALNQSIFGVLTGDKFIEASGASVSPSVYQNVSWISGTVYTVVVDAKADARSRLNLYSNGGAIFDCTFDLKNGTATGAGATISSLGNGWYRCTVTVTPSATTTANMQVRIYPGSGGQPYAGDGVSGLFVNSALVRDAAGNFINAEPLGFPTSAWSKQNVTVVADQAIFGGLPPNLGAPSVPLQGVEHVGLGTSLTAQGFYTSAMISILGTVFTNVGISGASLGAASNGHSGSLGIYNAIASISATAKIVTVECCTNDFAAALVPLGARGDSTTATFYGAMRAAINAIIARAPNANIFFISDHGAGSGTSTNTAFATNGNGNMLNQFWKAMDEVCADMGVWLIDAGRKAGVGYSNAGTLTSDGLHFNAAGGKVFGGYCAQEILRAYASGYFR